MGGMPRSHKGPEPEHPGLKIGRETMIDPHMLPGLPVDNAMFQHVYTAYFCDLAGDLVAKDHDGEIRIVCRYEDISRAAWAKVCAARRTMGGVW